MKRQIWNYSSYVHDGNNKKINSHVCKGISDVAIAIYRAVTDLYDIPHIFLAGCFVAILNEGKFCFQRGR